MSTRDELTAAVTGAKKVWTDAIAALAEFDEKAENNVFDTLDDAADSMEEALLSRAVADCDGRNNRGADAYTREFMVAGVRYVGILTVEYNRHDKTYYYVEESRFTYAASV